MISNVKLKVFLQNTVFALLSVINKRKKHDKETLMLYTNLGFRDNIKALYDFLIENEYNQKYEIIVSTNDYTKYSDVAIDNVSFVSNIKGIPCYFKAGYVFYCFGKLPILPGKNQEVIQLWHGSPFKMADKGMLEGHSWKRQYYTHVVSTAKNFNDFWSYAFSIPKEKILIDGHCRCDLLFLPSPNYDFGSYKKLILWAPTFRKSSITGYSDVAQEETNVVPVVKNEELKGLNEYLKSAGVKIVVKLHPMQDIDPTMMKDMDHLILMSNKVFMSKGMDLYRLMKQSDALITDYSSIFYDYLLLDRPIGFTEDDMDDYGNTRGYAVDNVDAYRPGERIKTIEDLKKFISDLSMEKDEYKSDRARVLKLSNDYVDGGYSKRLMDILNIKND